MNTNFNLQVLTSTALAAFFAAGFDFASCRISQCLGFLSTVAADLLCNRAACALVTLPLASFSVFSALQCSLSLTHSLPALLDFLSRAI